MKPRMLVAVLAMLVLSSGRARAEQSAMVLDFKGRQDRALHDRVVRALKQAGVPVVTAKHGAGPKDEEAQQAVSSQQGVSVFVEGNATLSKKGVWTLLLTTHGGAPGAEGELSLDAHTAAALYKKIDAEVPGFVRGKLGPKEGPAPAAPEPARGAPEAGDAVSKKEKKEKKEKKKEENEAVPKPEERRPAPESPVETRHEAKASASRRPSPLSVAFGGLAFSRELSYHQDVNENLRAYKLDAAPAGFVALGWYPGAHFTSGPAANIGIVAEAEQSVGASSALGASQVKYSTSMLAFSAGLRERLPIGAHELGLSARFGRHSFAVKGDVDPAALSAAGTPVQRDLVPDVAYTYLQPGLDTRFRFGAFGVGVGVGYRLVLGAGAIQEPEWFPKAKVSALDASAFVSYDVVTSLGVILGVDVRRYGYSMHSAVSDLAQGRDVAGGAIDQYLAAFLGLEYRVPGALVPERASSTAR